MINCKVKLDLSWSKECIISEISITTSVVVNPNVNPPVLVVAAIETTTASFQIDNTKLYVSVFSLPLNDNINFL